MEGAIIIDTIQMMFKHTTVHAIRHICSTKVRTVILNRLADRFESLVTEIRSNSMHIESRAKLFLRPHVTMS